jgi:hypothetical protein
MKKENEQVIPRKHNKACMNCTKLHHKCDKKYPTCSHCIKRNVKCIVNPSTKVNKYSTNNKNKKSFFLENETNLHFFLKI